MILTFKGHTDRVFSASFSPDGSRVVTASWDRTAKVWDAKTGAVLLTLKGHTDVVESASFLPDGSRVVTGSLDRTARIWDAQSGAEVRTLKGHTEGVLSVAFSPDGSRVVTASLDRTAKVWSAVTGAEVLSLKGDTTEERVGMLGLWVYCATFSPDGARIVTAHADSTAKIWDATPISREFPSREPAAPAGKVL